MIRDLLTASSTSQLLWEEGRRRLMRTILESRFGTLEPAELAALQAAEEPTLRALAMHVATDSREQMRGHLGVR